MRGTPRFASAGRPDRDWQTPIGLRWTLTDSDRNPILELSDETENKFQDLIGLQLCVNLSDSGKMPNQKIVCKSFNLDQQTIVRYERVSARTNVLGLKSKSEFGSNSEFSRAFLEEGPNFY